MIILIFIGFGVFFSGNFTLTMVMIIIAGPGFSNNFPVDFTIIINGMPNHPNELSSLIILSVAGRAFIPAAMGLMNEGFGISAVFFVLEICLIYLAFANWHAIKTIPVK